MTKYQALVVKYLRMRCEGSWRWVAAKYSERYDNKIPFNHEMSFGGNQIDGLELCREASKILNEIID